MPSYVITGVSRGIGYAFLQNLSSNPSNTIVGIVRNVAETEAKIAAWKTPNIYLLEGDLTNYESLQKAAAATSSITSGSLDYLIANAGLIPTWSHHDPFSLLGQDPHRLTQELNDTFNTNVVGNIHLFNLFMPLILKGTVKKVITLSSGLGDTDLAVKYQIHESAPYSISKTAMNMATAKFQAEYEKDGVLFMGICPGPVNTGVEDNCMFYLVFETDGVKRKEMLTMDLDNEEENRKHMIRAKKFMAYAPHFKGNSEPEDAVRDVLRVVENASLAKGDAGAYVSHFGTKNWL